MLHKGALVQVILIYGPQHILGGMVAANRKIEDNPELRRLFVFRQNWLSEDNFRSMAEDCKRILGPRNKDFYPVCESNWAEFMSNLKESICLEHKVGTKVEFLFPHDVVTDTVKSIMSCLGKVRVICFGDGMGTVFSRNRIIISRLTGIKRVKKWLDFFFIERDFLRKVEIFHLMLPVVESKIKGVTTKVQIPDKISIGRTIDALCLESKHAMSEFIKTQMDENTAVVCLENLSESRFSEFDKEIQLYVHFISILNSKSKRVYLKPHPLQEKSKVELIAAAISDRDVLLLPESLSRTPVEYWPLEDFKGTICSMGVPNISLKYLYDLSVSNPASDEVIREFIENSYQESFFWVEEQLKRIKLKLENWDGASILFVQR